MMLLERSSIAVWARASQHDSYHMQMRRARWNEQQASVFCPATCFKDACVAFASKAHVMSFMRSCFLISRKEGMRD
jgi:hypothetical protein